MSFLLFLTAYVLFLPLSVFNFLLVRQVGYFRETALNLDKLANREFRTLWNATLRKTGGYEFGAVNETISSALGKNQQKETLTKTGKALVWLLDLLEKDHCLNAINENQIIMKPLNQPTPEKYTWLWKLGSFLYALVILLNENYGMITSLGLQPKTEGTIRIAGVLLYFLFTYFNFSKTFNPKKP